MAILETLKGWRTVAFNALSLLGMSYFEIVQYLSNNPGWEGVFGKWGPLLIASVNIANIVLRAVTNTKIGSSGCSQ